MGALGAGLYSNDVAADLKTTVSTLLGLPLGADEVLEALRGQEPSLSDPHDVNYTDAWFVVADQFHRYGIAHQSTLALVIELIDSAFDLDRKAALGMTDVDLRARAKVLEAFRDRIAAPHLKPFRTGKIKLPQAYVLDPGAFITYPTAVGHSANPYFKSWSEASFAPDGFGAAVVSERGRAFGYLAWYVLTVIDVTMRVRPTLPDCLPLTTSALIGGDAQRDPCETSGY